MTTAPQTSSPIQYTHRQILTVMGALMLGMLMAALDQTVVSTAMPTIVGDFGDINHIAWVALSYLLASTISTPLYGKLGDLYGRKPLFLFAISVFLAGSMLAGLSQNLGQLIGFRAIQGLGAGGLMVGAQAIIGDVVSPRERGKYQGMMGGIFALSSVAGPLIGGFLTDLNWRLIFYINIPIGIAAIFVTATVLHLPKPHSSHKIDWVGAGLLAGSTSALILFTTWAGSTYAWNSPQIIGLGVACVLLLIAFVLVERKVAEPIIPPRLFRNVVFNIGTAVGLVIGLAMFGAIFFLPPFLQLVDEASPTNSGLRMVPLMIGLLASSIISGLLISRTGRYKIFPVLGTGLATFGMYLLSTLTPTTSVFALSLYMVIVGIGMGMVMQILVMAIQNAIDHKDMGVATSSATFFRSIGSCLGLAIFGSIFSNQLTSNLRAHLPASAHINPAALQGSPAALANLPAAVHGPVVQAFADSLHVVFLTAFPFLLVAFVLTWFLKEVPLRKHAGGLAAEGIELGEATGEIVVTAGEEDLAPEPSPVA